MKKVASSLAYNAMLQLQPRIQWNENFGYCGETSYITAGLYFGQYLSQFHARALASPHIEQSSSASQLLLGPGNQNKNNDITAANAMQLTWDRYSFTSETSTTDFLSWVKRMIAYGFPVAIGVLMNTSIFDVPDPDSEYDHIVPVYGISSNHTLSDTSYYPEDEIYFYDNGVYRLKNGVYDPGGVPVNYFSSSFQEFQNSRNGANTGTRPYSLLIQKGEHNNYGMALKGITPNPSNSLRIQITTDPNQETNEIEDNSSVKPSPIAMTISITALGLVPGVNYMIYRFNSFDDVKTLPLDLSKAVNKWPISSTSSFPLTDAIRSDEVVIYRVAEA
jgi:hypothetical protein